MQNADGQTVAPSLNSLKEVWATRTGRRHRKNPSGCTVRTLRTKLKPDARKPLLTSRTDCTRDGYCLELRESARLALLRHELPQAPPPQARRG